MGWAQTRAKTFWYDVYILQAKLLSRQMWNLSFLVLLHPWSRELVIQCQTNIIKVLAVCAHSDGAENSTKPSGRGHSCSLQMPHARNGFPWQMTDLSQFNFNALLASSNVTSQQASLFTTFLKCHSDVPKVSKLSSLSVYRLLWTVHSSVVLSDPKHKSQSSATTL